MTTDQFVAILVALTGLVGAMAGLWRAVANNADNLERYHVLVNSRLDALLELTASSSFAKGAASLDAPKEPDTSRPD
jgi:uncharacterized membrane protein